MATEATLGFFQRGQSLPARVQYMPLDRDCSIVSKDRYTHFVVEWHADCSRLNGPVGWL